MAQQLLAGDRVQVVNVAGVPGNAYTGSTGTVLRLTGDLVRLRLDGAPRDRDEAVVVQRRVRALSTNGEG
jgi:hypothetical protein